MTSESPIPSAPDAAKVRRGRWTLIGLFALFFVPIFIALGMGLLNLHSSATKNKGEWIKPYTDLRAVTPRLADGSEYHWNPEQRIWRIVLAPPENCTDACIKLAQDLDKVWQLFGRKADHVEILWIGTPPAGVLHPYPLKVLQHDPSLLARLPAMDDKTGVPVYIVDPNGFVLLRYPPGFDPADLRSDMAKLLKLM
jgi:hypothetical protein